MTVFNVARPARPITENMFADLGHPEVAFDPLPGGGQKVTVPADLTADQIMRARCRLVSPDADREALLWQAYQAWKANKAFLAIDAPTADQAIAQVSALTAQVNGVMRLLLPELDTPAT